MSKQNKALAAYTQAALAVKEFREKNAKVFGQYDSLLVAVTEAEKALKDEVKLNLKANIANEYIKVNYAPAFKKWYDPTIVFEMVTPKVKKTIIDAGALVQEIDKAKFEELVELGQVPVEVKQAAYKEQELAPRVSIKEL